MNDFEVTHILKVSISHRVAVIAKRVLLSFLTSLVIARKSNDVF